VSVQPLLDGAPNGAADPSLELALLELAARATELDANPRFPRENFESLRVAGVPQSAGERERSTLGSEVRLVRAVAGADSSTARILDGHFNGVERLAMLAPGDLCERELDGVRRGELLFGVWGADPSPGEGAPASIERNEHGEQVLRGVKTFCSGAGGVERALVVARDEQGARRLVYLDTASGLSIDRSWYRASGLRASESHRVEFLDVPVLAILGEPDEVMREPWFSRDAIRTASTWAGISDRILSATVAAIGERSLDELRLHARGRMRVAQGSIDRWLEHALACLQPNAESPAAWAEAAQTDPQQLARWRSTAAESRIAIAEAARLIAAEAVRVCGSRALIDGEALDRARRDLDLFLLQHRLDPKLVELGSRTLEEGHR